MRKPAPPRHYPRIKSGTNPSPKFGPVSSHKKNKSLTVGTNTNGQLKYNTYGAKSTSDINGISKERKALSNGQILTQLLRELKHLY